MTSDYPKDDAKGELSNSFLVNFIKILPTELMHQYWTTAFGDEVFASSLGSSQGVRERVILLTYKFL